MEKNADALHERTRRLNVRKVNVIYESFTKPVRHVKQNKNKRKTRISLLVINIVKSILPASDGTLKVHQQNVRIHVLNSYPCLKIVDQTIPGHIDSK
jgi:hypothetical protein